MRHAKELGILREHLAKHGLKVTTQREVILDAFLRNEHITAEQLYRMLGRHKPHIGLATIYRTLNLLCESGIAQERHFGSQTHYDNVVNKRHHDHMICTHCGAIIEFENCDIEHLQEEVARRHGFTITTHKLELYGLCGKCKNKGRVVTVVLASVLFAFVAGLLPATADAADRLVIYSGRKEKAIKPVVDAFTKQTGIQVDLKVGKTAGLANEIRMEKARPRGDLYISTESGIVEVLTKDGLLDPYQSAATKAVPEDFRSAAGSWTGISGRARIILYNKNLVPEKDVPKSIFELTNPQWKGKLAIAGTRERTTLAWATALVAIKGEAFTRDYLKGLHANDLKILTDNTEVWQGVGRGEFAIGLTNSPNYYLARQNNLPVGVVYPDQDAGGFGTPVNPNVAAVIKGAASPEAARRFIDFLLSREGQRILVTQDYEIPLVDGADAGEVSPLKSIKRTAVTAPRLADLEEATLTLLTLLNPNW